MTQLALGCSFRTWLPDWKLEGDELTPVHAGLSPGHSGQWTTIQQAFEDSFIGSITSNQTTTSWRRAQPSARQDSGQRHEIGQVCFSRRLQQSVLLQMLESHLNVEARHTLIKPYARCPAPTILLPAS